MKKNLIGIGIFIIIFIFVGLSVIPLQNWTNLNSNFIMFILFSVICGIYLIGLVVFIILNHKKKIIEEYIVLAPFTTPNVTLESKKIKTTTYKMLKENKNTYLPLITYQDGTIFVGYKKIQP